MVLTGGHAVPQRLQEIGAGELDHSSEELISITEGVVAAAASVPCFKLKRRNIYLQILFTHLEVYQKSRNQSFSTS